MQARVVVVLLVLTLATLPAIIVSVPPPPHSKVGPSAAAAAAVASSTVDPAATEATTTDDGDDSYPEDWSFKDGLAVARRHRRQANGAVAVPTDASPLLADPSLPAAPAELANTDPDCLLWQYVQSGFMGGFSNNKFQNKVSELCLNGTGQGNWCHVDMDLVLEQMDELGGKGGPFRVDTSTLEELQIFVQFTQNGGIWQVVELPMCDGNNNDNSNDDSNEEGNDTNNNTKNLQTRLAFRYLF